MPKTYLITGASTGIGAEAARQFAPDNTIVVHYNSSEQAAASVADEVEKAGGTAILVQADLATREGCETLANKTAANCPSLDVLINNAGGLIRRENVRDMEWSLLEDVFALNVFSTIYMSRLCIPQLEKGYEPCIINVTSIAMRTGAPTATAYGASKGALDTFTRGLARELAPKIRVNAVAPGIILTPFHHKVSTPEQIRNWEKNAPVQRNGTSEEVVSCMKLLIENTFLTGETIDVNGGMGMR